MYGEDTPGILEESQGRFAPDRLNVAILWQRPKYLGGFVDIRDGVFQNPLELAFRTVNIGSLASFACWEAVLNS